MSSLWSTLKRTTKSLNVAKRQVRFLNLLEFQSKNLLRNSGVAVQNFCLVDEKSSSEFENFNAKEYVVKAQILAGGRGKGHFDNGFKGGVQLTTDRNIVKDYVSKMLGHNLITKQTPKQGIPVKQVMIAESVNITKETYICILMDRTYNGPVIIASPAGGMDIEGVAEKTPELIKKVPIDIHQGVTDKIADDLAAFLEFKGEPKKKAAEEIKKIWEMFKKVDATQLEINPLAETDQGLVISVDAKVNFDDNAKFRQKDVFSLEDHSETDPREVEAAKYNLNYIGMDGNIGCMVNGAGLAMATMDIIKLHGGEPANFLDVGGSVQENQVRAAFNILTSDPKVKSIFVNVFGGIVNCAVIAKGIVAASKDLKIPLIVRLEGTNVAEAKKIIRESGLNIQASDDFDEAAKKAVASAK
ncbi:succinate--CoA ligase [GDP-forming] subunit beta, mitochondrial [Onthophagus taurus]|uniref:succinate--CoA ligase [GDP-forming] subunit beta, mitochondrial n=1 Tax=Onthophagus taurus TaxID=166361 RepID=UPI000C209566|nr:succinate--CoA ligase [GDP-forming] subunit beta, mitochondrial [Onthophagus taurus]